MAYEPLTSTSSMWQLIQVSQATVIPTATQGSCPPGPSIRNDSQPSSLLASPRGVN
ncbi:MAG: hypothetical protein ACLFPN_02775 [Methanomassiliicoccales archaeon]